MNLFFVPVSRWLPALVAAWVILATSTLFAQPTSKHLNPVIEKLAAGKPFIGVQTNFTRFMYVVSRSECWVCNDSRCSCDFESWLWFGKRCIVKRI